MNLQEQLAETEVQAQRLRQRIASATCLEAGHDWQSLGGCNAGCASWCGCSVPVRECARCGDSDYGDNDEADEVRRLCAERRS